MNSFDTQHTDIIHDAQVDYYGKRLATASSDRTIRIFNVDSKSLISVLRGHEGPVWQVSWCHPKFGSMLASCGYDRKVIIWKEVDSQWVAHINDQHTQSVNSVAWSNDCCLAAASSDGCISIITPNENNWTTPNKKSAHKGGVNAVSWSDDTEVKRFVTGGCDNQVKIWTIKSGEPNQEEVLSGHTAWVRDVAWAPSIGLPYQTIASCSQDGKVIIWRQMPNEPFKEVAQLSTSPQEVVWRVSWSTTGNILAVTSGDNNVTLYTESLNNKREWKPISRMDENGTLAFTSSEQ